MSGYERTWVVHTDPGFHHMLDRLTDEYHEAEALALFRWVHKHVDQAEVLPAFLTQLCHEQDDGYVDKVPVVKEGLHHVVLLFTVDYPSRTVTVNGVMLKPSCCGGDAAERRRAQFGLPPLSRMRRIGERS
jgi:hypothetical protein